MADVALYSVTNTPATNIDSADHNTVIGALQGLGVLYNAGFTSPGTLLRPYGHRPVDATVIAQGSGAGSTSYPVPAGSVLVMENLFNTSASTANNAITVGGVTLAYTAAAGYAYRSLTTAPVLVSAGVSVVLPIDTYFSGFLVPLDSRITPKVVSIVAATGYTVTTGKRFVILGIGHAAASAALLSAGVAIGAVSALETLTAAARFLGFLANSATLVDCNGGPCTVWGYEVNQ